ncbi:MAG: LacI family DNA-binding transcriptional regulator [Blautia sp.]|nr:LacI family DNA-binding transcriptional regulator [Blautia sp.]
MGATIKDIARQVGVSPSTVSRVLNGNAVISEETKAKIRQAMKDLNYHPNSRARNFANGSTDTIALVIDAADEKTFSNSFFNRSVYAIEKTAQQYAYNLLIINDKGEHSSSISTLVYEKKVDGLILPPSSVNEGLLKFLDREEFPYVVLGEPAITSEQMTYVDIDNLQGSIDAVKHLKEKGYQRIALVIEDDATVFSQKRIAGYLESMEVKDFDSAHTAIPGESADTSGRIIFVNDDYEQLEHQILNAIRECGTDAFLCASNEIAFHVLKILRKEDIRVPKYAGIVTFDNFPLAEYMDPPLTVVDVDTYQLGQKAAEKLMEKINKRNLPRSFLLHAQANNTDTEKKTLIRTTLIERGSSAGKE